MQSATPQPLHIRARSLHCLLQIIQEGGQGGALGHRCLLWQICREQCFPEKSLCTAGLFSTAITLERLDGELIELIGGGLMVVEVEVVVVEVVVVSVEGAFLILESFVDRITGGRVIF